MKRQKRKRILGIWKKGEKKMDSTEHTTSITSPFFKFFFFFFFFFFELQWWNPVIKCEWIFWLLFKKELSKKQIFP